MRVIDFFDRGVQLDPERVFVKDSAAQYTYGEAAQLSHQAADAMRRAGIPDGAHVAIYAPNSALTLIAMLGVLRGGHVWVPINARNARLENVAVIRIQ
ncbi:putative acyl-CoA ligase [Variovorax paradoxus B4]|uniref:Putative acyl-CoA ligase n=1 Tax=Variovorax paradoxus B4 TaxID=1246301 RepID=T1X4K7_VARPD|nr:AMP-binding protein [Variovorax paradoxus]AGU47847.1 putative acyl-CoA ligase [Variovorax paradoxus B4]